MQDILAATDGSALGQKAVKRAAELAVALKARLTVLHVQDNRGISEEEQRFARVEFARRFAAHGAGLPDPLRMEFVKGDADEAFTLYGAQSVTMQQVISEEILAEAAGIATAAGMGDAMKMSEVGNAADRIVATAERRGADLIVMGRHGLGGFPDLLMGSVTRRVLHKAKTDVLTVI